MKFYLTVMCRTLVVIIVAITALYASVIISSMSIIESQRRSKASTPYLRHNTAVIPRISRRHFTVNGAVRRRSDFIKAIAARADSDRYIILAMTDEAFADMAINFYESSLRVHHIDNFLFVGVGRKICKILTNKSIPCFYYADDQMAGKASEFGEIVFNRKVTIRIKMILDALAANFTVINTDVDVAFIRNPVQQIKVNDLSRIFSISYFRGSKLRLYDFSLII